MSDSHLKQRLVAILAADAAGYSRLMAGDDRATVAALDTARAVFRRQIEANQGRVIDMVGDSVLAVFETATGAVAAALAIQQEIGASVEAVPEDRRLRFRIGVHLGDVIEKADGTVYGDGVNIAARLEGLAEPGGITLSDMVHGAVRDRIKATFEDAGEHSVKNIPRAVRAYRVLVGGAVPSQAASGRESYGRRAWGDAYESLSLADQATPLGVEDLENLAISAYLIGRDDEYLSALERAHHGYLDAGEEVRAARCAFWLGLHLSLRGETGRATGWLARAQRLLEREQRDCVEQGYLLLPVAEQHLAAGDHETAYITAVGAAKIGERFREPDLIACARHVQGRALMLQRQVQKGLALLDEAMVAVTAGELSPIMTGLIYCSVIEACQQMYELDRAHEWTSALALWCEQQPEMVAFTGVCRVHRAEIMQLHGAWRDAIEEARRAGERCQGVNQQAGAAAFYQQAEVYRLRGEFTAAEEAYRKASQWGWEPQPGLALLRLAQGRTEAAAAAIRRVVSATEDRLQRTRLVPAYIEIMLAVGEIQEAREACRELEEIAESFDTGVLGAMAAHARGTVDLAEGDAEAALGSLRRAGQVWQQIEAPYLAARVRVLVGLACRALGDDDGAALELEAARVVFEELGAAPDLAGIDSLIQGAAAGHPGGLTPRELQVLRLVSAGKTNKAIAAELSLSGKTVDRHLSNIFTKLDVPSRAAATAYAYKHKLI